MVIHRIFFSGIFVFFTAFLSSCSTLQDVVHAKETGAEGTTRNYLVNDNQAWDIAKAVFRWEGCDAIEEHRDQGYMLTSSGMNLVSQGTVMGAWIEKIDSNNTKVTVVTKRRVTINIATTLTEGTFHKRFEEAVGIIRSGKQLPANAPVDGKFSESASSVSVPQNVQPSSSTASSSPQAIPIQINTPAPANNDTSQSKSTSEKLRELNALYKDGYINKEDFETKKREILNSM